MARSIQIRIKKIISLILISIFTLSVTACSSNSISVSYYDFEQEENQADVLQADISRADFYAQDLAVIPNEEWEEDEDIAATSSLLVNRTTNEGIYADDIYDKMYPASLTKLITALVVLEQGDPTDIVTISYNASHILESGAKLGNFKEGDKIDLESLLNIFLIYSANDAGIALAEHISGSEEAFAEEMNKTANRLGAVHSNFINSHGLHDENHYTTSYDLYLIFNELLNHEEFVSIINKSSITVDYTLADGTSKTHQFMNTNRYLLGKMEAPENITVVGGKTGTTGAAGNCLVLYSVDNVGNEYVSIVLQAQGGNSLYNQMNILLEKAK